MKFRPCQNDLPHRGHCSVIGLFGMYLRQLGQRRKIRAYTIDIGTKINPIINIHVYIAPVAANATIKAIAKRLLAQVIHV